MTYTREREGDMFKAGILNVHSRKCVLIFLRYHSGSQKSKIHLSMHKNNIVNRERSNLTS